MKGNLFSESWYKVAELQVGLLNSVHIQKQYYRGKLWYVLQDSFNYNYYRINKETYGFVARLTPDKTVEQVWEECLEIYQEDAPSQDDVIKLLSQLHLNNLLYFRNLPNNEFIFERHLEKKGRQIKTKLLSIISIKIPLWNPDRFLDRILPLIRIVFSLKGAVVWGVVVFLGAKAILDHTSEVYDQTQGILSQSNLIYLYLSLAVMKFAHEMGHAAISKCFGRPVYSMGIMFLVFTPLPFMDATTTWFLQNRWKRVLIGSAGMMVDLFLAAVAALIWSNTGDGLVHSVAFNMMMVGSISSIFFNGNPLLRFDAYYILTDLLQIPNLYQRSRMQWQYWLEKYVFAINNPIPPSEGIREAIWLALYALASLIYRIFLTVAILLFVTDKLFALGLLLAIMTLVIGVVIPVKKVTTYLFNNPKLQYRRKRAIAITMASFVAIVTFLGFYPFSYAIRAPGIIESKEYTKVYAQTEGRVEQILVLNGMHVNKGEVVAILSNRELDLEMEKARTRLVETRSMIHKSIFNATADLKPLYEREAVLKEHLADLENKKRLLVIEAQSSGIFVSPNIDALAGRWVKRQTWIGSLIGGDEFKFSAIVSQDQASNLFQNNNLDPCVKLYGSAAESLPLSELNVIPYEKDELPSAALGWFGGGNISVSSSDRTGKKVTEPFFEVKGDIAKHRDRVSAALLHGRSGVLRLGLPPEPLASQAYRAFKQTVQKRYKL